MSNKRNPGCDYNFFFAIVEALKYNVNATSEKENKTKIIK